MIYNELYDLRQYVTSTIGANCIIGNPDTDDTQYPLVKIIFEEEGTFNTHTEKQSVLDMPITLRTIVTKGNELDAFKIVDKIALKMNQFNSQKGHMLAGSITPEYDDDTKTYVIDIIYNIKLIFQDTEV